MPKRKKQENSFAILVGFSILLVIVFKIFRNMMKIKKQPVTSSRVLRNSEYAPMAELMEAMARHESGVYSNLLATDYNNIFSMKEARKREFVREGVVPFHALRYSGYRL